MRSDPLQLNHHSLSTTAPPQMSAFLRGKQAGISHDLSEGILPGLFALDDRARLGINSQIRSISHNTIQVHWQHG